MFPRVFCFRKSRIKENGGKNYIAACMFMFETTQLEDKCPFMVVKQYKNHLHLKHKRLTISCPCMSSHLLLKLTQLDIHTHNLMILLHRNGCILRCLHCNDLKLKNKILKVL